MQQYADIYLMQSYSSFAVNKYLHTVAAVGFLFTFHERYMMMMMMMMMEVSCQTHAPAVLPREKKPR